MPRPDSGPRRTPRLPKTRRRAARRRVGPDYSGMRPRGGRLTDRRPPPSHAGAIARSAPRRTSRRVRHVGAGRRAAVARRPLPGRMQASAREHGSRDRMNRAGLHRTRLHFALKSIDRGLARDVAVRHVFCAILVGRAASAARHGRVARAKVAGQHGFTWVLPRPAPPSRPSVTGACRRSTPDRRAVAGHRGLRQSRVQRRGPEGPPAQGSLQGAAPHHHARRSRWTCRWPMRSPPR